MPGLPTEILNEDIKELRADFREMRNTMDSLRKDLHGVSNGLTEVKTEFRFAKWILGFLLLGTISGIGSGIWWAATITADMKALEANLSDKTKMLEAKIDEKAKATDARFEKVDARFDKIEAMLAKLLEQGKSTPKAATN
jgi:chromosome segregation ATPase